MTNEEFFRLAISLHTSTVIGLLNAVEQADTAAKRTERLALIHDAVLEFKTDFIKALTP